jgi:exosome complex exonuclease DIS3/RRP44
VREEGETPNDRNDRGIVSKVFYNVACVPTDVLGIRKATAWYNSHLKLNRFPVRGQSPPKIPAVVLMTEDAANRQIAEKSGIASTSGLSPALSFLSPFSCSS